MRLDESPGRGAALRAVPALAVSAGLLLAWGAARRMRERRLQQAAAAFADRSSGDDIAAVEALLAPSAEAVRALASRAAEDPAFFRTERSREVLHDLLERNPQLDAIMTSFEDGYHRVVTRVDDDRRRFDPQIPANARWHSSYIDADKGASARVRHRTMFSDWPTLVKTYDVPATQDIRARPSYQTVKRTLAAALSDPEINGDTGAPILPVSAPIVRDGRFLGFACANITFDRLAENLARHKASPNSVAMIVDAQGQVIAHPDLRKCVRKAGGQLVFATLSGFADEEVRLAAAERATRGAARLLYKAGQPPVEFVATFTPFPPSLGKPWEILTVAPAADLAAAR